MGRFARKNVKNLEDAEKWLQCERKIRLSDTREGIPDRSLESIYKRLCEKREATYFSTGKKHCGFGKARSLHDLYLVYKYYNPEKRLFEILDEIIKFYFKKRDENPLLRDLDYCPNINKYNFRLHTYFVSDFSRRNFLYNVQGDFQMLFPSLAERFSEDIYNRVRKVAEEVRKEED